MTEATKATGAWTIDDYARLPAWVEELREDQVSAIEQIMDEYAAGAQVVVLEAPTGAGKTLIAELVRRRLRGPVAAKGGATTGLYACTTKSLQHQFNADFDSAVLMGKRNYPTELAEELTCDDCMGRVCVWCESQDSCPYKVAVREMNEHELGVTNLAYLLGQIAYAREGARVTDGRGLLVVDEADELEGVLVGRAGIVVGERLMRDVGVEPPKKGCHKDTLRAWCVETGVAVRTHAQMLKKVGGHTDVETMRKVRRLDDLKLGLAEVAQDMMLRPDEWVRDYEDGSERVKLQPVKVGRYGRRMLWDKLESGDGGTRVLVMSASILDAEGWAEDVGLIGVEGDDDGAEWEVPWAGVSVPMRFPVANRPIWYVPAVDMSRSGGGVPWEARVSVLAEMTSKVLTQGVDENTIAHTVSYALSRGLVRELDKGRTVPGGDRPGKLTDGRPIWTYREATERDAAIGGYREHGGLLVGSSLERGIDLPGELCRMQVICKVPFPNLGDTRTNARMRVDGGARWYATQTARSLVQMTGRGVRGMNDHAGTVILDSQFGRWWGQWGKTLLPAWWREAVQTARPEQFFR